MRSPGWADLYGWWLDRTSRTPLSRQIYIQIRSAVTSGAICPGAKLPSSRAMASGLDVARGSVVEAYRQLTGSAGEHQVRGVERFLTFNMGGSVTTSVVMIWGLER